MLFLGSGSTQPSIPPGLVNRVPALLAGVKVGCVRLCRVASNIVWQLTPHSSAMKFPINNLLWLKLFYRFDDPWKLSVRD